MKRVFVTGATGFIGSYLVRSLLREHAEVAILVRPESDLWRVSDIRSRLRAVLWDGVTVDSFAAAFRAFSPDTVFHLGWSGVRNTYRNEMAQVTRNIDFTVALTQLAVACGTECLVGAGSQAEYGPVNHKIDELVLARPTTLYGAAKLSAGILTERIAALGGLRHIWVRIFSTYGPKDNSGWMIPSLIAQLRSGERPALTAGEQQWDYLHVCDAAEGLVLLARSGTEGVFNLGSGVAYPLKEVVLSIRDLVNASVPLGFGEIPYRDDQVMCLQADITKLTSKTGWSPKIDLWEGLSRLITESSDGVNA